MADLPEPVGYTASVSCLPSSVLIASSCPGRRLLYPKFFLATARMSELRLGWVLLVLFFDVAAPFGCRGLAFGIRQFDEICPLTVSTQIEEAGTEAFCARVSKKMSPFDMNDISRLPHHLDRKKFECKAIIETPKGKRTKFKYEQDSGLFSLSSLLPEG